MQQRQGAGDGILVPVVAVALIALAAASLLIFRRPHGDAPASLPSAPARRVPPSASPRSLAPVPRPSRRTGAVTTESTGAPPGLTVEADVPGADVFVDREYKGKAPIVVRGLASGSHHLNVAAEGFDGYSDRVEVTGHAQTVSVRLKGVTLDVSVDVVHHHTLGSCRGRLYATPAGLRFRPVKGDDGFDVPLAAVEEMQVDYARKNLRVRLHGGRTYNFGHPDGNVDALLSFAQAAEKARKKLERG